MDEGRGREGIVERPIKMSGKKDVSAFCVCPPPLASSALAVADGLLRGKEGQTTEFPTFVLTSTTSSLRIFFSFIKIHAVLPRCGE